MADVTPSIPQRASLMLAPVAVMAVVLAFCCAVDPSPVIVADGIRRISRVRVTMSHRTAVERARATATSAPSVFFRPMLSAMSLVTGWICSPM